MTLSLKASFYATATPLVTTTGVVQAHRRKNPASLKNNYYFLPIRIKERNGFLGFSFLRKSP